MLTLDALNVNPKKTKEDIEDWFGLKLEDGIDVEISDTTDINKNLEYFKDPKKALKDLLTQLKNEGYSTYLEDDEAKKIEAFLKKHKIR